MRFGLELSEPTPNKNKEEPKSTVSYSPSSSTPKEDLQWFPLQDHPVFTFFSGAADGESPAARRLPRNLMAWDGASRIYLWDPQKKCLHRFSVRLGEPHPTSVIAASPSKVLHADVELDFVVTKISINRNGLALFLAGAHCIRVMYLYGRTSSKDNSITCRAVPLGSEVYNNSSNAIRILQVMWHPYSDTHLAVLSSDSVFRIYDMSSALGVLEQEYYLQPVEPGRSRNASSICPVDFCFGRDHLWDRFSAFILFSDGSVYVLCPVAPFGSVYIGESIMEIYSDAKTYGLKSSNSIAISNSNMAISWLEATFPELNQQGKEMGQISAVKARPYVVIDASLSLQGPLRKVCHGEEDDSGFRDAECDGRAVSFLYNTVGKDSILVTAWSGGQLQIDALADEIQPIWHTKNPPRVSFASHDRILGFAMICEPIADQLSVFRLDQPVHNSDWLGHPPPLLRLAIVDLALPRSKDGDSLLSLYVDPLIPERIFCLHDGGVDSIVLHFLPFTNQTCVKDETMKTPSVHPILSTCQGATTSYPPLCGFVVLSDSFGYSWIAGVTSSGECIVLEMKTWNVLLPKLVDKEIKPATQDAAGDRITPDIISKELLTGPKVVIVPQGSNLQSVAADSIEGRSTLHQYFKLFHENYVEYAHKVYFELKHHGPHVKKIIDNMHTRLGDAQNKLMSVEEKKPKLDERITRVIERHEILEERLHKLRRLPGIHKKPLTRAEREFKAELGHLAGLHLLLRRLCYLKPQVALPQDQPLESLRETRLPSLIRVDPSGQLEGSPSTAKRIVVGSLGTFSPCSVTEEPSTSDLDAALSELQSVAISFDLSPRINQSTARLKSDLCFLLQSMNDQPLSFLGHADLLAVLQGLRDTMPSSTSSTVWSHFDSLYSVVTSHQTQNEIYLQKTSTFHQVEATLKSQATRAQELISQTKASQSKAAALSGSRSAALAEVESAKMEIARLQKLIKEREQEISSIDTELPQVSQQLVTLYGEVKTLTGSSKADQATAHTLLSEKKDLEVSLYRLGHQAASFMLLLDDL